MSLDVFLAPGETLDVTAVLRNHAGGFVVSSAIGQWVSSDPSKATVAANGTRTARITGVASSGTTQIRAVLTEGPGAPLTSSVCLVHCIAAAPAPGAPRSIQFDVTSALLGDTEVVDITATILDKDGNAVVRAIDSWTSSDVTKATVASTGDRTARITGVGSAGGSCNVTAHLTTGLGSPLDSGAIVVQNRGAGITATGGTITDVDGYRIHTFTGAGTFQITAGADDVEILVVAGAGSGADVNGTGVGGGGGGAGEVVHVTQHLGVGSYGVTVGAGGPHGSGTTSQDGQDGGDSTFNGSSLLTARGGGGGVCLLTGGRRDGLAGGSGGGAAGSLGAESTYIGGALTAVAPGVGHAGGNADTQGTTGRAGGGGGAGAPGSNASAGGTGGQGVFLSITGTITEYGRGGDGALATASPGGGTLGVDGAAHTGNGGGGGGHGTGAHGGAGGSGVVIVRYPLPGGSFGGGPITATGGTVTDIAGYRVHEFDASGTFHLTAGNDPIEYLIVGGGGAGASIDSNTADTGGGGGGGGEVRTGTLRLPLGDYTVTIGAGGVGAKTAGVSGGDSSFGGIIAKGGGGGGIRDGSDATRLGKNGGNGGGGGSAGGSFSSSGAGIDDGGISSPGTGSPGGRGGNGVIAGGGGGAGGPGKDGGASTGGTQGQGGPGVASAITGTSKRYGGGGGGGSRGYWTSAGAGVDGGGTGSSANGSSPGFDGKNGTANTGGGGGGAGSVTSISGVARRTGGSGGKGVIILRYPH